MLTPRRTVILARLLFGLAACGLLVLMLGPFQGLEQVFGLNDKAAHLIAFYGLAVALFAIAPNRRRGDLALFLVAAALGVELLQGLTGRSVSITDFLAGSAGVGAAWLPGQVERLRYLARTRPDLTFAEIAASDKRRRRRRQPKVAPGKAANLDSGPSWTDTTGP